MTPTLLSTQMKASVADFMPRFLENKFVKGIADGELSNSALISYTQQDNLYLEHFLKFYQEILGKLSPKILRETKHEINTENYAHQVLLNVAGTDNETIMQKPVSQKPTTKDYLNHIQKSLAQATYLGLAAMQACPYVYNFVADELIKQEKSRQDNPFKDWIDFYQSEENGFGQVMFDLLDETVPASEYQKALTAFQISVKAELDFFEQATENNYDRI